MIRFFIICCMTAKNPQIMQNIDMSEVKNLNVMIMDFPYEYLMHSYAYKSQDIKKQIPLENFERKMMLMLYKIFNNRHCMHEEKKSQSKIEKYLFFLSAFRSIWDFHYVFFKDISESKILKNWNINNEDLENIFTLSQEIINFYLSNFSNMLDEIYLCHIVWYNIETKLKKYNSDYKGLKVNSIQNSQIFYEYITIYLYKKKLLNKIFIFDIKKGTFMEIKANEKTSFPFNQKKPYDIIKVSIFDIDASLLLNTLALLESTVDPCNSTIEIMLLSLVKFYINFACVSLENEYEMIFNIFSYTETSKYEVDEYNSNNFALFHFSIDFLDIMHELFKNILVKIKNLHNKKIIKLKDFKLGHKIKKLNKKFPKNYLTNKIEVNCEKIKRLVKKFLIENMSWILEKTNENKLQELHEIAALQNVKKTKECIADYTERKDISKCTYYDDKNKKMIKELEEMALNYKKKIDKISIFKNSTGIPHISKAFSEEDLQFSIKGLKCINEFIYKLKSYSGNIGDIDTVAKNLEEIYNLNFHRNINDDKRSDQLIKVNIDNKIPKQYSNSIIKNNQTIFDDTKILLNGYINFTREFYKIYIKKYILCKEISNSDKNIKIFEQLEFIQMLEEKINEICDITTLCDFEEAFIESLTELTIFNLSLCNILNSSDEFNFYINCINNLNNEIPNFESNSFDEITEFYEWITYKLEKIPGFVTNKDEKYCNEYNNLKKFFDLIELDESNKIYKDEKIEYSMKLSKYICFEILHLGMIFLEDFNDKLINIIEFSLKNE